MTKFDVTLLEYPATHLIGMKVQTSIAKAKEDCGAIWEKFMPRTGELCATGENPLKDGSFGVSAMLSPEDFNYWAALPAKADTKVPAGMESFDIPAGLYAKVTVPSLEKLMDAFMYIYGEWPNEQADYTYKEDAPGFEWYPADWEPEKPLYIFALLKKK